MRRDIWWAVQRGDLQTTQEILEKQGWPEEDERAHYSDTHSLLATACAAGHIEIVKFLLDWRKYSGGGCYVPEGMAALRNGRMDVLQLLLERNMDPSNSEYEYGSAPIEWAMKNLDVEATRLLLFHYDRQQNDYRPEHEKRKEFPDYLLPEHIYEQYTKADFEAENEIAPIELAVRAGDVEFTQFLIDVGEVPEGDSAEEYLERARQNYRPPKPIEELKTKSEDPTESPQKAVIKQKTVTDEPQNFRLPMVVLLFLFASVTFVIWDSRDVQIVDLQKLFLWQEAAFSLSVVLICSYIGCLLSRQSREKKYDLDSKKNEKISSFDVCLIHIAIFLVALSLAALLRATWIVFANTSWQEALFWFLLLPAFYFLIAAFFQNSDMK